LYGAVPYCAIVSQCKGGFSSSAGGGHLMGILRKLNQQVQNSTVLDMLKPFYSWHKIRTIKLKINFSGNKVD
jgi:hypothetical protein